MKIRTDFVTNSSSSSFISFSIKSKKLPELIKKYLDGESIKDGEYSETMHGDVWFSIDENEVNATMESESFYCDLLGSVIEFVQDNSYYIGDFDYEYEREEGVDYCDDVSGSASTSYLDDSAMSIMCEIAKAAVGEEKTEKAMKIIKELKQDYRETSCEIKASYNTQY